MKRSEPPSSPAALSPMRSLLFRQFGEPMQTCAVWRARSHASPGSSSRITFCSTHNHASGPQDGGVVGRGEVGVRTPAGVAREFEHERSECGADPGQSGLRLRSGASIVNSCSEGQPTSRLVMWTDGIF